MNVLIVNGAIFVIVILILIGYALYRSKHHVYLMPVLDTQGNFTLQDREGLASVVTINQLTGEISIVSTRMYRYFGSVLIHLKQINHQLKEQHLQYHQSAKDLVFIYKVHLDFEMEIPRVTKCTDVLVYQRTKRKGPQTVDGKGNESPVYELKQVPRSPVNRLR